MRRSFTIDALVAGVAGGDRRAVARALTLVENRAPEAFDLVRALYPRTGRAFSVGVTGPPGVGKSSLIASLLTLLRSTGTTVGVVSVDPSSPFSHGAVLGDRIRLADHFLDPGVFIRSMATRDHLGGLAEATLQAVLVLDAAGKDCCSWRRSGSGRRIRSRVADTILPPDAGLGDSVQALKAGVMEIPDVIAINKRDHPLARTMLQEVRAVLALTPDRAWSPPIVLTEALRGEGVDELWVAVESHRAYLARTGASRPGAQSDAEVFSGEQQGEGHLGGPSPAMRSSAACSRVATRLDPLSAVSDPRARLPHRSRWQPARPSLTSAPPGACSTASRGSRPRSAPRR
jgi:LAO/AO transport system kinase